MGEGGKRHVTGTSCQLQNPGIMELYSRPPENGGLELGPNRNQNRARIRVLGQEEVISLQSSAQVEALRPDSCVQDQGTRKNG